MEPNKELPDENHDKPRNGIWSLQLLKSKLPQIFTLPIALPSLKGISDITDRGVKMSWPDETVRIMKLMPEQGIFHTGIESSDPFVEGERRNQLKEAHDFLSNYEQRLEKIKSLGITWLRFGIPYSMAHLGPGNYDFDIFEKVSNKADSLGITIIADLLHFGLPDWLHENNLDYPYFQNSHFPERFAQYAGAFAQRFPDINHYTIVNEPFVTANLSAKIGFWNETRKSEWYDDKDFVRAISNIAKAAILGRQAIEKVWSDERRTSELLLVQNESFEAAMAAPGSGREAEARRFNLRRFAALDLIFGNRDDIMEQYLIEHGLSQTEYNWFMEHGSSTKTILGIDHYPWCVYILSPNEQMELDPLARYQLYELSKVYWQRYKMPLLHTEINGVAELAVALCQKTYDVIKQLREEGYPMVGMGWYGDEYQVGWQSALAGSDKYREYPVGLYYKGELQPVASLFHDIMVQGLNPTQLQGKKGSFHFLKRMVGIGK
jgi:hypothetical protein